MAADKADPAIPGAPRGGARRAPTHRQNLMVATLLVPLGATLSMAVGKVVLRHVRGVAPPAEMAVAVVPPQAFATQTPPLPPAPRTLEEQTRAVAVNEARLRRDAGDIEARSGLVMAEIAAGRTGRADMMGRQAIEQSPSDPRAWLVAARAASATGERDRALQELARARSLRLQQLGYSDNGDDDSTLPTVTLSPGAEPFRGRTATRARWTPPPGVSVRPVADQQFAQSSPDLSVPPGMTPAPSFGSPAPVAPPTTLAPPLDTGPASLSAPSSLAPSSSLAPPASLAPAPPAFGGTAGTNDVAGAGSYGNPFRQGGLLPTGDGLDPGGQVASSDPLTQQIDRQIAELGGQINPSVQAGFGFRVRSGSSGLSQLTELSAPLEGEFSPNGYGRLKVAVTPTFLMGGRVGTGIANQQQFGTGAFGQATVGRQSAQGTALDVSYAYDQVTADIGSTPLGFRVTNVVGGVQWNPRLSENVTLQVLGERRAITDSVLSFGGARDPTTGVTWGGVTRSRGQVSLQANAGLANFYAGFGAGVLTGTHVQHNSEIEAGAGTSYPVYQDESREVRLGLSLIYLHFNRNLGSFTLGQGGYFSPQQFLAAIVPVVYREKISEDLNYEIGGSVGVQNVRNKSSLYYPIDPGLQANLVAQQADPATAQAGVGTVHGASHSTGIAGAGHAQVDYRVDPSLHLGARVSVEHVGDYTEGSGLVYARYIFNQAGRLQ